MQETCSIGFSPIRFPVGAAAPGFSLPDQDGNLVSLADLHGRNVVLVFYPGDDTTVCRKQLCEFRDRWPNVKEKNTVMFGVNPQGPASHARFREKFQFPFPLLVDRGQKWARSIMPGDSSPGARST